MRFFFAGIKHKKSKSQSSHDIRLLDGKSRHRVAHKSSNNKRAGLDDGKVGSLAKAAHRSDPGKSKKVKKNRVQSAVFSCINVSPGSTSEAAETPSKSVWTIQLFIFVKLLYNQTKLESFCRIFPNPNVNTVGPPFRTQCFGNNFRI